MTQHNNDAAKNAAQYLITARQAVVPGARIPEQYRPTTVDQAFAIQEQFTALSGLEIGGWKCSSPAEDKLIAAPIYAADIYTSAPTAWDAGTMARVEPEVAFVMDKDLPPRATPYTEQEIRGAIREVRIVLEIIGSRYADPTGYAFPEMLADRLQNQGLYIGPVIANALDLELTAFPITVTGPEGVVSQHDGQHPNGHPLPPFYWLANFLNTRGTGLRAGQIVITGSYDGIVKVPFDTPLTVQFGTVGNLNAQFTQARTS